MKKLLAAVVLLGGGVAFAQIDATEVGPELKEETKEIGQTARENVKELGQQAGVATADEGTFKAKRAFTLNGELAEGGSGEVTVTRQGLPDAVLDIRDQTMVKIDGKKADASKLEDGMKVKAWFQLEGEETVAVRIDAKSMKKDKAVGGAGKAGMKDDKKADEWKADDKAMHEMDKAEDKAHREMKETENELK